MQSTSEPSSKAHWAISLVGTGIIFSLMTLAVTMGRYAEQVDGIAQTIEQIGETGRENLRLLSRLESDQVAQEVVNNMTDKRLERLETAKDAIRN